MSDQKVVQQIVPDNEKLAFVEAFLLGLARQIDQVGYLWPDSFVVADDCRQVARSISRVGIIMERKLPPAPPAMKSITQQ